MFVGVCRLVLHLPGNESLKGKRKVVRSLVERTKAKFNVSVAEVASNDEHRRAVLGFAVIGNAASHVDSMLAHIGRFVESTSQAPVQDWQTEVMVLGDDLAETSSLGPRDAKRNEEIPSEEEW